MCEFEAYSKSHEVNELIIDKDKVCESDRKKTSYELKLTNS